MVLTIASTTVHSVLSCHPVSLPLPPPNIPFALISCSCFVVNRSEVQIDRGREYEVLGRRRRDGKKG